jgi:hypothetical protein
MTCVLSSVNTRWCWWHGCFNTAASAPCTLYVCGRPQNRQGRRSGVGAGVQKAANSHLKDID